MENMNNQKYDSLASEDVNDRGGFGWGLLGCCLPIVGLVLFLVWKNEKPRTAKAAGIGALISAIVSVLVYIFYFIVIIGVLAAA